jgi:glycosyltransferase involved in cell wall biosynthesis
VYLPGQVEDVPALLRSFDFFVQPSINEGISNTILEAQSCGLGVVATNVGGNPELIEHGYNGLLVDAGNTESLAGAIESYIDNPETRRKHGDSARSMVKEKFGIGVMSEAYLSVYEAMTRKQRVTGAS